MAARKMTFSLPDALAAELVKCVAARDRSRYVADALRARLSARDEELALACDVANRSADVRSIEREFDAIQGDIVEPWTNAPSR
jgi:Arc/MetJ family transcription regulator